MELLFSWELWVIVSGVSFIGVIGFILIDEQIHHAPKPFREWWKRNMVDDFPYEDDAF